MKKSILIYVFFCLVIQVVNGRIYTGRCDTSKNKIYWELDTETGNATISGKGKLPFINMFDGYIFDEALLPFIKHLSIEKGITYLAEGSFNIYPNLESITIPSSVKIINHSIFSGCSKLVSVSLPPNLKEIEFMAFSGCSSLRSITIPGSVKKIHETAFSDCINLRSISVDPSNSVYDSRHGCNAIIETGSNSLIIGCISTNIPDDVERIGNRAFSGCSSLKSITIPGSVKEIGSGAFCVCSDLTSVILPESLEKIGNEAFSGCSSLRSITIPSSVKEIGEFIFAYSDGLTNVTVMCKNVPTLHTPFFRGVKNIKRNCVFQVPSDCFSQYKSTPFWKDLNISSF